RFEMLTWSQLGIHDKPIGVLNVDGFYDALVGFVEHARRAGFIRDAHAANMMVETTPEALLARLQGRSR
ncbi:MAG: LOG family protein, partial [Gammaproteobacteria bacterium]